MFWPKNIASLCYDWRVIFWIVFANSDCACVGAGPEVLKYHILLTLRKYSKCLEIWSFQSNFRLLILMINFMSWWNIIVETWFLIPKAKVWLFSVLLTILPLWMTFLENCNSRLETLIEANLRVQDDPLRNERANFEVQHYGMMSWCYV